MDYVHREEQARLEYIEWMLEHNSDWPDWVECVTDAYHCYLLDSEEMEEPEYDIFYWDFRKLRCELSNAKNDWERKAVIADKLQSYTGYSETRKIELMRKYSCGWFETQVIEHEGEPVPSEEDIKQQMREWAARAGGAVDYENPF